MSDQNESSKLAPAAVDSLAHTTNTSFNVLRGVSVQDLITQLRYLPREAQKHVSILNEARVNRAANPVVAAKIAELKDLPDSEMVVKLDEFMPSDVAQRADFFSTIASDQARSLAELYTRSQQYKLRRDADKVYVTPSPAFMATAWDMPATTEQSAAFAAVPVARRESWYDLSLHYLAVNSAESKFEQLRTCLQSDVATASGRNTLRPRPCKHIGVAAEAQVEAAKASFTDLGMCKAYAKNFKQSVVETPDLEQAKLNYGGLVKCVEVYRTLQAINEVVSVLKST